MASVGDTRVDHASGAARRRRERRLRAYFKYARMSVAMALAEAEPPHRPTGTEDCQSRGHERHVEGERVAGDAVYFELFDEDTAGLRPGPVLDPSAAGAGSAAHYGADDRRHAVRADPRRSCAADGGTAARGLHAPGHADAG